MMAMIPPYSPDALRAMMRKHRLTGARTGALLRVDPRTVRRWCAGPGDHGRAPMPESAWLLLLILIGETDRQAALDAADRAPTASQPTPPETAPAGLL